MNITMMFSPPGTRREPGIGGMLIALAVERIQIRSAARPAEPKPPVADVGVAADLIRTPSVVGVADIVMVIA